MTAGGFSPIPLRATGRDVGTVKSLWEANMDLLGAEPVLDLNDDEWRIYSRNSGPACAVYFNRGQCQRLRYYRRLQDIWDG